MCKAVTGAHTQGEKHIECGKPGIETVKLLVTFKTLLHFVLQLFLHMLFGFVMGLKSNHINV